MASKMTHKMRAEIADVIRRRYQAATGKEKPRILGGFIATTGYHEKSAIRVLNAPPRCPRISLSYQFSSKTLHRPACLANPTQYND